METYTVFLSLPSSQTISIRGLDRVVPIEFFQAKIELEAGLPSDTYALQFGKRTWKGQDIELDFTRDLRNGAMMKILPTATWDTLYLAARTGKVNKVLRTCDNPTFMTERSYSDVDMISEVSSSDREAEDVPPATREQKLFFSLCVACAIGATKVVYSILKTHESRDFISMQTPFARTLFHIAAANDKLAILELLGADKQLKDFEDMFGQTPMDIAREVGAIAAQRVLRNLSRNRKRVQARRRLSARLEQKRNNNNSYNAGNLRSRTSEDLTIAPPPVPAAETGEMLSPSIRISYLRMGADGREISPAASGARWVSSRASSARRSNASSARNLSPTKPSMMVSPNHRVSISDQNNSNRRSSETVKNANLKKGNSEEMTKIQLFKQSRIGLDPLECPSVPCSSPGGSIEDLTNIVLNEDTLHDQTKEELIAKKQHIRKAYTRPKQTSYRAQSAKYYRTQFHEDDVDPTVPKPRPKTAGTRYRQWKTWLLQKMDEDELKAQQLDLNEERMKENQVAYKKWLRNKQVAEDEASDTDSDDDNPYAAFAYEPKDSGISFDKWLELRKDAIAKVDAKIKHQRAMKGVEVRRQAYDDRRMTIFEFRNTDEGEVRKENPDNNMRAYQRWQEKKRKYELWKERSGGGDGKEKAARGGQTRAALVLDGMTYDEWLGEKFG